MRLTNEEQQLLTIIEKHFKEWDIKRFKAKIKSLISKEDEKGAT